MLEIKSQHLAWVGSILYSSFRALCIFKRFDRLGMMTFSPNYSNNDMYVIFGIIWKIDDMFWSYSYNLKLLFSSNVHSNNIDL